MCTSRWSLHRTECNNRHRQVHMTGQGSLGEGESYCHSDGRQTMQDFHMQEQVNGIAGLGSRENKDMRWGSMEGEGYGGHHLCSKEMQQEVRQQGQLEFTLMELAGHAEPFGLFICKPWARVFTPFLFYIVAGD